MELDEVVNMWIQKHGIMNYFQENVNPRPTGFLDKFLDGHN